ncbi:PREDICTED: coiled-coil domain-containing protein R3HCC1L isoform X2 [Vollenhovia emeryi]|uniref:coiled-coil domain-containing protein R3HCC1L isoform X2 n=1 Tax=Vollenhovia emeryi TaxID=411798 RepID=UPI0005F36DD8|nr:PREDICTED: coiled-coil domain-containing protein R3HCC1L isoform X2 [Vollenhovia emeryi]
MSLQDSLFSEDVEHDVTIFTKDTTRKSDWVPKPNVLECKINIAAKQEDTTCGMGIEGRRSPSTSPECKLQRHAKSVPTVEIYRPPPARRANNCPQINSTQTQSTTDLSSVKNVRQKRPDRAVYVPRPRRSLETEDKKPQSLKVSHATLNEDSAMNNNLKLQDECCSQQNRGGTTLNNRDTKIEDERFPREISENVVPLDSEKTLGNTEHVYKLLEQLKDVPTLSEEEETVATNNLDEDSTNSSLFKLSNRVEINDKSLEKIQETIEENQSSHEPCESSCNDVIDDKARQLVEQNVPDVLIISDAIQNKSKESEQLSSIVVTPPEKKVKKVERQKSKPVPPPSPPLKMNRDECDWDSLFDDNGDCLDPTLIDELTSAVGEVVIEQPKNVYKTYNKQVEVSSDEFAHVVEIYNFPSEFKTSDLAAVFSSFKNGGFELKWVDDTHCLGVFSSPLVAAEVLASNHPFVKTRPLSEATALSKTKARRSAEFLQPYRNRPETCAALARRLVTGALGVRLATARQEREHEKNVLREAKEKRRLANKQREDVWEGIIPTK